ncbi:MAG: hypothetical protein J6Y13_11285, partial [Treponema sp.]|nr:hypothetical protein [Treponema sp.]
MSFEVPKVETNKTVTIELSVLDANGTVLWYGTDTRQVKDGGNLQVSLKRQYWTLTPGCIAVSATSYSLLYDGSTWTSDATTLSVTGLDAAPAGSSFSYEWKDESGAVLGTDPTLTQTVFQLYGSPAGAGSVPFGDITKTITVTVSYTDATGAAVTADASAEIAVGGPVTLPAFSIRMTAPDSRDMTVSTTAWALTSLTDGIRFTPDAGTDSFPAGTVFDWEIEATGGSLITRRTAVGTDCVVSPDDLSLDESNMGTQAAPTTITVSCTAKNDRAAVDVDAAPNSVTQDVYLLYTIPAFTINITPPPASSYAEAKSDAAAAKYALKNLTGAFSFTPV